MIAKLHRLLITGGSRRRPVCVFFRALCVYLNRVDAADDAGANGVPIEGHRSKDGGGGGSSSRSSNSSSSNNSRSNSSSIKGNILKSTMSRVGCAAKVVQMGRVADGESFKVDAFGNRRAALVS